VAVNYTASWSIWRMVCELQDYDPYKTREFSIDMGDGRTRDFEYTGDIPKKEEVNNDQNEQFLDEGPSRAEEGDK